MTTFTKGTNNTGQIVTEFLCTYQGVDGRAKLSDDGQSYTFRGIDADGTTYAIIPVKDFESVTTMRSQEFLPKGN